MDNSMNAAYDRMSYNAVRGNGSAKSFKNVAKTNRNVKIFKRHIIVKSLQRTHHKLGPAASVVSREI